MLQIAIPIGFSFLVLHHVSFIVDLERRLILKFPSFQQFALYCLFFPKYMAGPIVQAEVFFRENQAERTYSESAVYKGFCRIVFGVMKKLVLADPMAHALNAIFDSDSGYSGLTVVLAIVLFCVQIYLDFSSYSDIAIGAAEMLGVRLPENFNHPLASTSVASFWRRWHISFMNWLTTYIYTPLLFYFRRLGKASVVIALVSAFTFSAFWHEMQWGYFIWALLNSSFLIFELFTKHFREGIEKKIGARPFLVIAWALSFFAIASAKFFFRVPEPGQELYLLVQVKESFALDLSEFSKTLVALAGGGTQEQCFNLYTTLGLIMIYFIFERKLVVRIMNKGLNLYLLVLFILVIFVFGLSLETERFIYLGF